MSRNRHGPARKRPATQPGKLAEAVTPESAVPLAANYITRPGILSPAMIMQLQRSIGNQLTGRLLQRNHQPIQRKGNNIPTAETMPELASSIGFFNKDNYDKVTYTAVLNTIRKYYSSVPDDDYGHQLVVLDELKEAIKSWESKNGEVTSEITSGFWGMGKSQTDEHRVALKELRETINTKEEPHVQQQGKTQATLAHTTDRAKLQEYVDLGLKSDDRWLRNSAEWIQVGKTKLYAVTPTGDSYARLTKRGRDPIKDEAWFPTGMPGAAGDLNDGAVTYNETSLTDNTNVNLYNNGKRVGGWNTPGVIAITNPAQETKETVWETLRHEVQHDSDKHKGRDSRAGMRAVGEQYDWEQLKKDLGDLNDLDIDKELNDLDTDSKEKKVDSNDSIMLDLDWDMDSSVVPDSIMWDAELDLTRYKTEYRAYSYQDSNPNGAYNQLDNTIQDKAHDGYLFSARQLAIFKHIYDNYPHTKTNWDKNSKLSDGRTFRQAVQQYWNPDTEGFNKYNSVRIDDFYLALDMIGMKEQPTALEKEKDIDAAPVSAKVSDETDPGVVKLLEAIDKLNGDDAAYIVEEGVAMQNKIKAHLGGKALQVVEEKIRNMAPITDLNSIFGDWNSMFDDLHLN